MIMVKAMFNRVLAVVALYGLHPVVLGQCHCGSSQMSSIVETGSPTLTLPKGTLAAEFISEFRHFTPHESDGHNHVHTTDNPEVTSVSANTLSLRYGLTPRLMLSLSQPWLGLVGTPHGAVGFGDAQVMAMGEVLRVGKFGAGLQAGLELPTGRRMPGLPDSGLMIGSGSWDFLGGAVLAQGIGSKNFLRASALYKRGTIGLADLDFGEFFSVGAVFSRTLWGNQAQCMMDSTQVPKTLNAYAGVLAERSDPQRQYGDIITNTGGDVVFAQAGLLLSIRKWSIPFAVLFPLYQDPLGEQNLAFCRARIGLIRTF
jgi:hypothetical protein